MSQSSEKIKRAVEQIRKLKKEIDREKTLLESGKVPIEEIKKVQKILIQGFARQETGSSVGKLLRAFQGLRFDFPKIKDFENAITAPLKEELKGLATSLSDFLPKDAENPIAVRLSNGKEFYEAIAQFFGAPGGGSSTPTVASTATPAIRGVPIVNPDGTNISAGGGPATIADGADVTQGALADAVVAAGATGSVSAKLRRLTTDLNSLLTELQGKADLTETQPVSIAGTVTVDSELPTAAALADTTVNPTIPLAGAALELFNGTTWDRVRGDITNGLDVDVTRLPALVAGTANIGDVDVASIAAGDNNIGNVDIVTLPNLNETLADDAAFTPATSRVLPAGFEFDDTTPDSVNEGDIGAARMSANRNIYVNIRDNAGNERGLNIDASGNIVLGTGANAVGKLVANSGVDIGDVDILSIAAGDNNIGNVDIVTMPSVTIGTFPDNEPFNVAQMNGVAVTMGSGVVGTGVQRVVLATDVALPAGTNAIGKLAANSGVDIGDVDILSIAAGDNNIGNVDVLSVIPGTAAASLGKAEDVAHTTGDTGVYVLAVRDDTLGAHSGTDGDYESLHTTATGALWSSPTGNTTGGNSIFRSLDIDETEEDVKTSAGTLYTITAFNTTAAPLYLKFYNATAANVTVGTTTPVLTFVVPGNADSDGAGFVIDSDKGWRFGTAITVACTTGVADADTGAPGANACVINLGYV